MEDQSQCECRPVESPEGARRSFLKKAATVVLGFLGILGPIGAGLAVLLDPLRRKGPAGPMAVRVTTLGSLPDDGFPRKFAIVASRVDAWNRSAATPIGAVYLRRAPGKPVQALNVVCPHAGCFVDFSAAKNGYLCPCHNSTFGLDGKINDPGSPSPRGLDELAVEIRNENEIWVRFQNYRAGVAEKIPA
jgi:Rieske Fe-S protein